MAVGVSSICGTDVRGVRYSDDPECYYWECEFSGVFRKGLKCMCVTDFILQRCICFFVTVSQRKCFI